MKDPLAQRIVSWEAWWYGDRLWLRGLTNFGDSKALAVFESEQELHDWLRRAVPA